MMNIERLQKLANFLRTLDKDKFDMASWYFRPLKEESNPNEHIKFICEQEFGKFGRLNTPEIKCGSVACALGWACSIPEFQEAGLFLGSLDLEHTSIDAIDAFPAYLHDDGNYYFQEVAASKFFGIGVDVASSLFYPSYYDTYDITPDAVADKIEALISNERSKNQNG